MPTYYSLHLGLNNLDPAHYPKVPVLRAAVNDASDWVRMAKDVFGYRRHEILTDAQATAEALLTRLDTLADELHAGDALLLTYSGHGGQIEDALSRTPGDEDKDETWCLYNRQVLDDELYTAFSRFKAGVRISVIADCCHSGTSIRELIAGQSAATTAQQQFQLSVEEELENAGFLPRRLSREQSARTFAEFYNLYRAILGKKSKQRPEVAASVQLFAACQDDQVTYDGKTNGIFTDAFKTLVDSGEWRNLTQPDALLERLRSFFRYPEPNYMAYGEGLAVFEHNFPLLADLQPVNDRKQSPAPIAQATDPKPGTPAAPATMQYFQPYYKIRIEWPGGVLTQALVASLCPEGAANTEIQTGSETAVVWFPGGQFPSVWEPIYHIARQADKQSLPLIVEPVAVAATPLQPDAAEAREAEEYGYLPYWPPVTEQQDPPTGWHLDDEHSQLASARDFVWEKLRSGEIAENVRIGHLDTGWYPTHPGFAFNPNIRRDLTRTFVDKEKGINQAAIDLQYKGGEQQGHGSGTLGVLACWSLDPHYTGGTPMGYLGAIPFAEVVPIRIADSVLIFDSENFCEGLEYAMEIGCEVVSMSMGGKPSRRMAKTINRAYEKGITIVTAAGNNMAKGLAGVGPKIVVWPARFQRVLAACGACHNHIPYDFEAQDKYATKIKMSDYRYMQGNWGPAEAMHKALAAYSPNVTWVIRDEREVIGKRGGGTSAVTPQIAAAAAMWIALHKAELKKRGYAGTWKQVEAVRQALFQTADQSFAESRKYYGNGILRAKKALEYGVPEITADMKSEKADSTLFGLNEALRLFLDRRRATETPGPVLQQSLELELQHLLLDDEKATGTEQVDLGDSGQVLDVVKRAKYVSEVLGASVGG